MYRFICGEKEYEVTSMNMTDLTYSLSLKKSGTIDELKDALNTATEVSILDEIGAGVILSMENYVLVNAGAKKTVFEVEYQLKEHKTITDIEATRGKLDYLSIMMGVDA